jgi:hypothetical protein
MAPELFVDSDEQLVLGEDAVDDVPPFFTKVTKETDVFAYGLVALQVLTNKERKFSLFVAPKSLVLPRRRFYDPELTMNNQLWYLFEACCDFNPMKRPTMNEVRQRIRTMDW